MQIWKVTPPCTLPRHVGFCAGEKNAYSVSVIDEILFWNAANGTPIVAAAAGCSIPHDVPAPFMWKRERYTVYPTGSDEVELRNLTKARVEGRFTGHQGPVLSIGVLAALERLVTGGVDRTVRLWDMGTRKELKKLNVGQPPLCVAPSANATQALCGFPGPLISLFIW